jgi:hypothetical protein
VKLILSVRRSGSPGSDVLLRAHDCVSSTFAQPYCCA